MFPFLQSGLAALLVVQAPRAVFGGVLSNSSAPTLSSSDPTISSLVASATSSASLKPYAKPSQKVEQVLAVGDSFTAGIGSNGEPDEYRQSSDCQRYKKAWPVQLTNDQGWNDFNGEELPALVFGACSGATMNGEKSLNQNQLKQGEPRDVEYTPIGKPQIAVLTITGNDVGFTDAIIACVYTPYPFSPDCTKTLNGIGDKIDSIEFKTELIQTLVNIVAQGRLAKGANPPESFQLYLAGYIKFWNDVDPGCDEVSWSWWSFNALYLTRTVRKKMNDLTDQLNGILKDAATELAASGVILVEGFEDAYKDHRFCEPAPKEYLEKSVGAQTWFWHQNSGGWNSGDEGSSSLSTTGAQNFTQIILDKLIPDKGQQASISASNPPWKINPAFKSEASLDEALKRADPSNKTSTLGTSIYTKRSFHPKGTAYGPWANAFLTSIKENRNAVKRATTSSSSSSPSASPSVIVPPGGCSWDSPTQACPKCYVCSNNGNCIYAPGSPPRAGC